MLVYREMSLAALVGCLARSATTMGIFLLMLSTGSVIGLLATRERLPAMVEQWLGGWTDSPQIALLLILLALLVLGCFLDATAILVMTAPFLAPLAASLGLDPVHFGILMICMVMIGGITPPFGILMFIACQLTGATMAGFVRDVVPFLIVLLAVGATGGLRAPDRAVPGQPVLSVEYAPPPSRRDPIKQGVLALGMAVLVVVASLQVGARYFFDRPLAWSEEAVRYVMIWTALLAAAWSVRDREHITVDLVMMYLPARGRRMLDVVRNLLVSAFCLVLLPVSIRVTWDVHSQLGVAIEIPLSLVFASLPLALVLMAWWSLRMALRGLRAPAGDLP